VPFAGPVVQWLVNALLSALVGLVIGGAVILLLMLLNRLRGRPSAH